MGISLTVGIAKTPKYASRESGDTADIIERPDGGLSAVLIDGQGSGRGAKDLSLLLSGRASSLIREGVRDGAVARALNDVLLSLRRGAVSATLDMVSVDLAQQELLLTRQGGPPAVIRHGNTVERIRTTLPPLGRRRFARPEVWQYPLEPGTDVFVTSDGIANAGVRHGSGAFDMAEFVERCVPIGMPSPEAADLILAEAMRRDQNLLADDCTVIVLGIRQTDEVETIRRVSASFPLPGTL